MTDDAPYLVRGSLRAARVLQRAGQWDAALAALAGDDTDPLAMALRADIAGDRYWWQCTGAADVVRAGAALRSVDAPAADLILGAAEYGRVLFARGGDSFTGGEPPRDVLARAAEHPRVAAWASFWLAVCRENLDRDPTGAAPGYAAARAAAEDTGDRLLESYAIRHQGFQQLRTDRAAALELLRRSLALRTAIGARPHAVAAQIALADAMRAEPTRATAAESAEAHLLRTVATAAAEDLSIPWLR